MDFVGDYKKVGLIRQAGANWVEQAGYWLFGNCTYVDGNMVSEDKAIRDAKFFFNAIDRHVLSRKALRAGQRLERQVYLERGKARTNTHLHFFIKGKVLEHYEIIQQVAERLWNEKIYGSHNCIVLDNTSVNRNSYGWKEFNNLRAMTLLVECCN